MSTVLLLFVLGVVFLCFDFLVPGVLLAALGTLAFLAAIFRAFHSYGTPGGFIAVAAGAVLLAGALYIEYGILPKTRFGKKFFLHAHVKGSSQTATHQDRAALLGRQCIALTPLVPTGHVEIDGQRYEALSLDGRADRGARLQVTGSQNFSLTVVKL